MDTYIKSDLFRYTGKTTLRSAIISFFINRAFRIQVFIRLSKKSGIKGKLARIFYYINRYFTPSIQISYRCSIGYGLYIGHGGPVIVSRYTSFGNNVYIGPNVCIIGNVKIGDNVTIGAGSVVVYDIPSGVTVAGNPAKIISEKRHNEFIQNPWCEEREGL